ncbi:MAG: L-lysine 6-transaminase [Labilithrix sp.]|nr:L-lysine 6-transaminase [Labilithrix sp.]MCW5818116.1 L-lysine 6-transaminase [Labilithrix sp.]
MFRRSEIQSAAVHDTLRRHILVDGYPLVVDLEKSRGSLVRDALTGKDLVDFYAFFASNPLGFNHPGLLDERTQERLRAVSTVKVANSDKYTTYFAEFVDTLERTCAPPELTKYFFVEGGALAVENALKTAFDWKVRKNIASGRGERGYDVLHLEHAFHGRSGYTMSLTNTDPNKVDYFPKFPWPRVPSPMIRFPLSRYEAEVEAREKATIAAMEAAFDERPHDIAAIIVEPIQSEGGDHHFRASFFKELRRLADENDALLIYDEVQTGVGATGKWWCYQHHGVTPDICVFAKKLQVGGIFVGDRIDEVGNNVFVKPGRINSTWGGGLVDMVRATRILEIIVDDDLLTNAATRGKELLTGLEKLSERHPIVTNARGQGLLCAIDLPSKETRDAAIKRCFADGMLVLACGKSSLRFRPTLNVTQEIIAEGLARLEAAITEIEKA